MPRKRCQQTEEKGKGRMEPPAMPMEKSTGMKPPTTRKDKGKGRMEPPLVPTEMSTPRTIELFCWILDESKEPFLVEIEDNQIVDELKRVIATEGPKPLNIHQLALWKVSSFLQLANNSCP
jgi:Crinkler effector protein N-terminal domain